MSGFGWLGSGEGSGAVETGSLLSGMDSREAFAAEMGPDEGYDHEFDGAGISPGTLPSGWSWINQDTATFVQRFGHGRIDWGGGGTLSNVHAVVTSLPAGLISADIHAHLWGAQKGGFGGYPYQLVLRRSANGQMLNVGLSLGTATQTPDFFLNHYTDPDTFGSVVAGPVNLFPRDLSAHLYCHIVANSATDWDFFINYDGGCDFALGSANPTTLLGGVPDQIGFGLSTDDGAHAGCEWIRVRDIVTS